MFDFLIVGAGFAGSVIAERLARAADRKVLVIDRRRHVGGNAYDHHNDDGLLVHRYGPHIFHTNSRDVFVGRLATYKYYNMDQVLAQALTTFRKLAGSKD